MNFDIENTLNAVFCIAGPYYSVVINYMFGVRVYNLRRQLFGVAIIFM